MSSESSDSPDENEVIIQKKSDSSISEPEWLTHRWFYGTIAIKLIALYIYISIIQLPLYVDEQLHVPQAQKFCKFNYKYNRKISTTPGLYYFASLLLTNCDSLRLRLLNSTLSIVNHWLLYKIKLKQNDNNKRNAALWALSISLSAPILFFDHLFYTETLSICLVLAMIAWKEDAYQAAIIGSFALFVRQDNIFWIGYVILPDVYEFAVALFQSIRTAYDIFVEKLVPYAVPCGAFVWFVVNNNYSVALGEQDAHKPCLHLLQIAYFAEFVLLLAPGLIFSTKQPKFHLKSRFVQCTIPVVCATIFAAIQYAPDVHPYLVNDNRHYTFYLWKWFGQFQNDKIVNFGLAMFGHCVAVALVSLQLTIRQRTDLIALVFCTSISLVIHQLLEVRYFFVPFILFKLAINESNTRLSIDIVANCALNALTVYFLCTKEVQWPDIDYVQRIGW